MLNLFKRKKLETRARFESNHWGEAGRPRGATSPRQAEQLSTVSACVSLISSSIASLPAYVYRETEKGKELQSKHPLARLIKCGPNELQTWPGFVESLIASTLLTGNGLAIIERDTAGQVQALRFVPWSFVTVLVLRSGRVAYDVQNEPTGGLIWPCGRYLAGDVLHLRDRSDNGVVGVSRLRRASQVLEMGLTVNDFAQSWFDRGMSPSGILETDLDMSPHQEESLHRSFESSYAGSTRAGRMMLLSGGLKYKSQSTTAEDGELLTSRKFTTEEICRIFGVSPIMVADLSRGTFTNSVEMGRQFVRLCLQSWIEKFRAEVARSVFAGDDCFDHCLDFDLSSFMRADDLARWQSHKLAIDAQILTANEVREIEGYNSLPGV